MKLAEILLIFLIMNESQVLLLLYFSTLVFFFYKSTVNYDIYKNFYLLKYKLLLFYLSTFLTIFNNTLKSWIFFTLFRLFFFNAPVLSSGFASILIISNESYIGAGTQIGAGTGITVALDHHSMSTSLTASEQMYGIVDGNETISVPIEPMSPSLSSQPTGLLAALYSNLEQRMPGNENPLYILKSEIESNTSLFIGQALTEPFPITNQMIDNFIVDLIDGFKNINYLSRDKCDLLRARVEFIKDNLPGDFYVSKDEMKNRKSILHVLLDSIFNYVDFQDEQNLRYNINLQASIATANILRDNKCELTDDNIDQYCKIYDYIYKSFIKRYS